jgi:hypothetical protein
MKVRIEGSGHCVEIDGSSLDYKLSEVVALAEEAYHRTKAEPRQQGGFGGQFIERTADRQVGGSPLYHYDNRPVES